MTQKSLLMMTPSQDIIELGAYRAKQLTNLTKSMCCGQAQIDNLLDGEGRLYSMKTDIGRKKIIFCLNSIGAFRG
jgi:hypothetical protein